MRQRLRLRFYRPRFSLVAAVLVLAIPAALGTTARWAWAADYDITQFGAVSGSDEIQTAAIQQAIDTAAEAVQAAHAEAGGRVVIPPGIFRSGALFLKQGVGLHLAEGAVLLGSTQLDHYPRQRTRIEGHFPEWRPALLNGEGLSGVRITGSGTLDGNGRPFWVAFWKRRGENPQCTNLEVERPRLLYLARCRDVEISDIRLKDSGFWNLHLYNCQQVLVQGVQITAPHGDRPEIVGVDQPWDEISIDRAPSSDGIDIDSCQNVTIRKCLISVGDDCIALKGTKGPLALQDADSPPVENILVEDCHLASGHGMLTCGSEATLIRNVTVRRCRVGPGVPIVRLKLRPDTPQRYENFVFDQIEAEDAQAIFDVKPWTQFFDLQGHAPPQSVVRNVSVRRISGSLRTLGELRGNPGDLLQNIVLADVEVTAPAGLPLGEVENFAVHNVRVNGEPFQPQQKP